MDGLCLKFSGQSRTHSRPLQVEDGAMREFISKYADRIHGVLSCFDRMLFRRYLPIMSGWQMAQFFNGSGIRFRELKTFLECLGLPSRAPPLARQANRTCCVMQDSDPHSRAGLAHRSSNHPDKK